MSKVTITHQLPIIFLRAAIFFMAAGVLTLCALLTLLVKDIHLEFPAYSYAVYAVFGAIYATTIPYFIGIFKAWKLLNLIEGGRTFSHESAKTMGLIAACAAAISAIYIASLPFLYIWADNDDAPGLVVIGMVLVCVPMIIAVFAALLQRLISEAAALKSEHDLTV